MKITQAVDNGWVQDTAPDGLLGRHPDDLSGTNSSIGRMHVCGLPYRNMSAPEHPVLLIAVAKSKTQTQMNSLLKSWGYASSDIIAMDGGGYS